MPALILILVLAVVAGVVWVNILGGTDPETLGCPPPVGAPAGEVLPPSGLDDVAPAPPQLARVQVLNGNGERGEASIVAASLTDLGFVPAAEPANDPLHPAFELTCHGQIRFGEAGTAAARTLSLVAPCAELVRDGRQGDVVDLALGTEFTGLATSPQVRDVLARLGRPAPPPPAEGGEGSPSAAPAAAPVDAEQLAAARTADCSPVT